MASPHHDVPVLRADSKIEDGSSSAVLPYSPPDHIPFFRSVMAQILIVGTVFFCAPGMYNALAGLGAGGLATPYWNNASAAAGYVSMAFMCIWGGVIVSKFGVRIALWISSTGDIIYCGTLYQNSAHGTNWPLMVGSIISGFTDGLMYAVEGPVITAYPEEDRRGFALGTWVTMRSLAPIIGGAIIFGINHSIDSSGAVSLKTYIVLLAIMCCGPFAALLVSPPEKVIRRDGRPIKFRKVGFVQATKEWAKVVASPQILLLAPLMFTSWFSNSYTGTLQTLYFNVRTRSMTAFVIPFADVLAGYGTGAFLDSQYSIAFKARATFAFYIMLNVVLWIWVAVLTKQLEDANPVIDWTMSNWMGRAFSPLVLFEFCTMGTQTTLYWLVGHLSTDFQVLSYLTGTLRGIECAGQAVAFGMKSSATNDWASVGVNLGLVVVSIPFAWMVVREVGVRDFSDPAHVIHSITGAAAPTQIIAQPPTRSRTRESERERRATPYDEEKVDIR